MICPLLAYADMGRFVEELTRAGVLLATAVDRHQEAHRETSGKIFAAVSI